MPENNTASLIILAGGASSRMGSDKADLTLEGKSFLEIQIEKGIALGIEDIIISGYRGTISRYPVIQDNLPGKGPLSGMEACLRHIKNESSLVLGIDIPLLGLQDLRNLLLFAQKSNKSAVVLSHHGKVEPLVGVYRKSLAEPMLKAIQSGKGSVMRLLEQTGYDTYISTWEDSFFANINDPAAYEELMSKTP